MKTTEKTVYRVETEITIHYFDTLEEAQKLVGDYYEMFGSILGIEQVEEIHLDLV